MYKYFGIIIYLLIHILISLYCNLLKRRYQKSKQLNEINRIRISTIEKEMPVLTWVLKFVNDLIFLLFKLVGYIPSHGVRMFFYKVIFGMKIGKKVVIYYGLETRCPWKIEIGSGSIIGDHCILDAREGICIGNNVNISTGSWMWTVQHDVQSSTFDTVGKTGCICIEDRAWISSRTTLLPGTKVPEGCVLAAGTVLTKALEDKYAIYGGIPAKKIGDRNPELVYTFDGKHRLFL